MTAQALPYISFLGLLFGSTLVASRFSVGQFHPTTYIGLRLTIAGLSHVFIYMLVNQRYKWPTNRRLWLHGTIVGVMGTAVPMTFIVSSLQYLSSGIASILITTGPAITVIMAHLWLPDESLTKRKGAGVILALGGTMLLAARGESGIAGSGRANMIGYVMIITAVIFASAMTIYIRKYMRQYESFDVASIRMFVATLVVMPLSILFVGFDMQSVDSQGVMALVYAALIGTFGGLLLSVYNIKRFGATAAAMTAYVIPIVAGIGGVFFLDEQITLFMFIGMALIVAGIATINQRRQPTVKIAQH
ncbi:MAG: DMT family transporter [Chloroflexi bacterium]|nr:DMT family transporter [Chloroflexota bacterium]